MDITRNLSCDTSVPAMAGMITVNVVIQAIVIRLMFSMALQPDNLQRGR
ncbi:hypothetical protein VIC_004175 [Vibrio coralliilyticus ATCC BAA-450]|nr:hypothetical protein VIC_004175 [Vibrio coralliilyticus ATCC BAA-450]